MTSVNLAEILAKISDSLFVLDNNGHITFVNDKASQILDKTDQAFHDRISQALRDQLTTRFECFHALLKRWFEHQTYPNADGGLTVFSRDITSRRRLEEALRASEDRFRRLIDSDIVAIFVVESGIITEANDVFLKMVAFTRDDVVGARLRWRELTPPEYDHLDAAARFELKKNGVFAPYEKDLIRKDGARFSILIGGVTTNNEGTETLCLAVDLSQRKRAEQRMRTLVECSKILASSLECEKTFPETTEYIVSKLADACQIYVMEGDRPIRLSAAHRTPMNVKAEVVPEDICRILTTGKTEAVLSPFSRVLAPITVRSEVAGLLAAFSAKPAAFDAEDIHFFEAIAVRAGLALNNSSLYRETQNANRLKDEFVAIVSHELRTPLTPILGGVYMLRSEPFDRDIFARALELIERNAKTQLKIVDDLLDVSRALSGKLRLNIEPVDLVGVIKSAVDTIRPASDAKGIRVEVRLEPIADLVSGDADRLQQIVWNLLANSVKFTPSRGQIVVTLSQVGNHAEIGVTDNGIGIDAGFLPHVFDRFRQADASRTREHGGLGLGLAIVRHLVESHGGSVHAHSLGGEQGSTFIVKLPLHAAARAATSN